MSFKEIGQRETLPERVFKTIKESILNGDLAPGTPLPTEPEMEKQFGVSRAVIRDAVRLLKGQGLIDVKHGKGMFVSLSQSEAFTDALLTSLRRERATAWDVEQFEQIFLPQIFSVATTAATESEILKIKELAEKYLKLYKKSLDPELTTDKIVSQSSSAFSSFMKSILESTHNKLIILLGEVLSNLRKFRDVSIPDESIEEVKKLLTLETSFITCYLKALECRDPVKASQMIKETIHMESTVISILKQTPVGTSPQIPSDIFFKAYDK